jgi:hypothetical protein
MSNRKHTQLANSITGAGREAILARRVAVREDAETVAVNIPGKNTIRLGVPSAVKLAADLAEAAAPQPAKAAHIDITRDSLVTNFRLPDGTLVNGAFILGRFKELERVNALNSDLLAALKRVQNHTDDIVQAAIAKAEGETEQ